MRSNFQKLQFANLMRKTLFIAILSVYVAGNFLNLQSGWADNGDYTRIMTWYSSGPLNLDNWPDPGTPMWKERFFYYWIPYWKLDFPHSSNMFSSSIILWAPGVFLNRYFYSTYTLYLPIMSMGARLMLFLFLLAVMRWIDHRSSQPILFYLTIGFPLALLFSSGDVVAFFNSFYQENGSIVFLPFLFIVLILSLIWKRDWKFYLLYFATLTLVTTSKSSLFYLPAIALPFVISWDQIKKNPIPLTAAAVALVIVPSMAGYILTKVPGAEKRPYNSLFTGTLMLSQDPQKRLEELGMPDAIHCVGIDYYSSEAGAECEKQYEERTTYLAVFRTILAEPVIGLKDMALVADAFQNDSLQLGRYALNDPVVRQEIRLNVWSSIKGRFFPRSWLLIPTMTIFATIAVIGLKKPDLGGDLARIALFCIIAFPIDAAVEIIGDGQRDLLKHLFIPNLLFDFAFIAIINLILVLIFKKIHLKAGHPM